MTLDEQIRLFDEDASVLWDRDVPTDLYFNNPQVYLDHWQTLTVRPHFESASYYEFVCDPVPHWRSLSDVRHFGGYSAINQGRLHG